MTFVKKTRVNLVPFALGAMAVACLFLAGCRKEEAKSDSSSPKSYMKDPVFRKAVDERHAAVKKVAAEQAVVTAQIEEFVKKFGGDREKAAQAPGWGALQKKLDDLNRQYAAKRKELLSYVRQRISPKGKKISK